VSADTLDAGTTAIEPVAAPVTDAPGTSTAPVHPLLAPLAPTADVVTAPLEPVPTRPAAALDSVTAPLAGTVDTRTVAPTAAACEAPAVLLALGQVPLVGLPQAATLPLAPTARTSGAAGSRQSGRAAPALADAPQPARGSRTESSASAGSSSGGGGSSPSLFLALFALTSLAWLCQRLRLPSSVARRPAAFVSLLERPG
jgi:hypothetical protein